MLSQIALYLMNRKGFSVLNELINTFTGEIIEYVVIGEDCSVENDYSDEMLELCKNNNIKCFFRKDKLPIFKGYRLAIGWRWIIRDVDRLIILHDSILPKYRGFSPLVNMLINGEKKIGVTALFAKDDYDTGPILLQEITSICYPIKIKKAIEIVSVLYSKIACELVDLVIENSVLVGNDQVEANASYSIWRDEEDYYIDWAKDASYIKRCIDSLGYPYTGAKTTLHDEVIIIDDVEVINDVKIENRQPGKIIFFKDGYPVVICGIGLIKLTKARQNGEDLKLDNTRFRSRFGG